MKKRHTVNLDALAAARLDAIRRHFVDIGGFQPTKVQIISRALEFLCELEDVPDPGRPQVTCDDCQGRGTVELVNCLCDRDRDLCVCPETTIKCSQCLGAGVRRADTVERERR